MASLLAPDMQVSAVVPEEVSSVLDFFVDQSYSVVASERSAPYESHCRIRVCNKVFASVFFYSPVPQ